MEPSKNFRDSAAAILAECDPCGMLSHSELSVAYNYIEEDFVQDRLTGAYREAIDALVEAVTPQTTAAELRRALSEILERCYPERTVTRKLDPVADLLHDCLRDL